MFCTIKVVWVKLYMMKTAGMEELTYTSQGLVALEGNCGFTNDSGKLGIVSVC